MATKRVDGRRWEWSLAAGGGGRPQLVEVEYKAGRGRVAREILARGVVLSAADATTIVDCVNAYPILAGVVEDLFARIEQMPEIAEMLGEAELGRLHEAVALARFGVTK